MTAICTLVLRADRRSRPDGDDPALAGPGPGGQRRRDVPGRPVGVFQPSHDAEWNRANDFSLWRCFVRELAEELLGGGEDYHSDTAPIDYERWPLQARLTRARRAGRLRVYWLGLGTDPLTLAADMLTVAVFDADLFDATFAGLVGANAEGRIVRAGRGRGGRRRPFRAPKY